MIQKYLIPLLEAKENEFFKEGKKRINVPALGICHTALNPAFKLRASYAPRDPKEAEQFGVRVVVVDIPRHDAKQSSESAPSPRIRAIDQ